MTTPEQDETDAASEQTQVSQDQQPRMVPLSALEAERRKRQDLEAKTHMLQQHLLESKQQEPEDDPHALVEKGAFKQANEETKRQIREEVFLDTHPETVPNINKYLDKILEKKPWLADSVANAPNRYARATEIINDFKHLVEEPKQKSQAASDAERLVKNANKPGSPVDFAKSAVADKTSYLKSIQGTKEFREYRQKVMSGSL